jgi:glycosyltransferase involved in cell wall biosynthesis
VRYAIIGDGPLRADLERQSVALGLGERVAFLGFQRQVADLLAGCDVLVSSSRDNEGCSNSILEAMALGVPVVATNVGGNPELIRSGVTGDLCPMQDAPALASAIGRRLTGGAETAGIVARAREQVAERFSLKRMVSDYESLYHSLLAARGRGFAPAASLAQAK